MGYITVLPTLTKRQFSRHIPNDKENLFPSPFQLFNNGRAALWAGLSLLNLRPEDEILVPATICEVVLQTLFHSGVSVHFYNLLPDLDVDLDDLKKRVNSKTRAVYVNHYLGKASTIEPIRNLCDAARIKLIEDCAHGFTGAQNGKLLGTTGDITIFSYRKFLPLPDGGGLVINDETLSRNEFILGNYPAQKPILDALKLGVQSLAQRGIVPLQFLKNIRSNNIDDYLCADDKIELENRDQPRKLQWLSQWGLLHADLKFMQLERKKNYAALNKCVKALSNVEPLFSIFPADSVPYSYPFRIKGRAKLIRFAAKYGLYLEPTLAPPYQSLPNLVNADEKFPIVEEIAHEIVSAPVHQSLDLKNMSSVQDILQRGLEEQFG